MFFYLLKLTVFFGIGQQSNARAEQRKYMFFFGNAQPKSNTRAHLKQRKKTCYDDNVRSYFFRPSRMVVGNTMVTGKSLFDIAGSTPLSSS